MCVYVLCVCMCVCIRPRKYTYFAVTNLKCVIITSPWNDIEECVPRNRTREASISLPWSFCKLKYIKSKNMKCKIFAVLNLIKICARFMDYIEKLINGVYTFFFYFCIEIVDNLSCVSRVWWKPRIFNFNKICEIFYGTLRKFNFQHT
jgi:hypothetical protein